MRFLGKLILIILFLAGMGAFFSGVDEGIDQQNTENKKEAFKPLTPEEQAKAIEDTTKKEAKKVAEEKAEKNRQVEVYAATKYLKSRIHDSDSFEVLSALYMDTGAICFEFRAKNAFNATRKSLAVYQGDRVLIQHSDNNFNSIWNKYCGGKSGKSYTGFAKFL